MRFFVGACMPFSLDLWQKSVELSYFYLLVVFQPFPFSWRLASKSGIGLSLELWRLQLCTISSKSVRFPLFVLLLVVCVIHTYDGGGVVVFF